jgi:hypothetical protein
VGQGRLLLVLLPILLLLASDAHVDVLNHPAEFVLEPGFIEAVPYTATQLKIDDAAPTDELIVDVVRIGPLGRGKSGVVVVVDGVRHNLTFVAPTVKERKVGRLFASLPARQRVPLPTGSAFVAIDVSEPMGIKLSVGPPPPPGLEVPLVPIDDTADAAPDVPPPPPPATPATTPPPPLATTTPATPATPATTGVTGPATTPATTVPPAVPAVVAAGEPSAWPKLYAEVRAGAGVVVNGLQGVVPAGGARVMLGPRSIPAALGFAVDFDGQSTFVATGHWNAATTKVRLEGMYAVGVLGFFDADLAVAAGAGLRFAWHNASGKGFSRDALVLGGTGRVAPEGSFDGGPGRFIVAIPIDVTIDSGGPVRNFAPFAVSAMLGYRLEL